MAFKTTFATQVFSNSNYVQIVFTANACISIFNMQLTETRSIELILLNIFNIKNLCVHPACVVSISVTNLKNESTFRINQGKSDAYFYKVPKIVM
jgi:hypothetical protein